MNKLDCGCSKDQDGIDTDIFKLFPKDVMKVLNKSIGLDTSDYNDTVKDKMKEVAKNKGLNLRTMLEQNPLISKHIIMIEKHKKGGIFKYQQGGASQYPNTMGMYTSSREAVELQKGGQVNQEKMKQQFMQYLMSKYQLKSPEQLQELAQKLGEEGLKKDQQEFMTKYQGQAVKGQDGLVTPQSKGQFLPNNEYLVQTPENAEYFKKKALLESNPQMYNPNKMKALANRDYALEMDRFKQNRSVGSSQQFQPEVEYQKTLKNSLANRYGVLIQKNGGVFKYQQGSKFKAFGNKEQVISKDNKAKYIPGTYDTTNANTYGGIKSSEKFDASTQNAQAKIDYDKGVGNRTQSGLEGNRGSEGINLTDRLAKERQDLQSNFNTTYNTPEFKKRIIKGADGKQYVTDSTGKYNLGLYQERKEPPVITPKPVISAQDTAVVLTNSMRNKNKNSFQVLTKPKEAKEYTVNPGLTEKLGHTFAKDKFLTDNRLKADVQGGKVFEYKGLDRSYYGNDTIPVTLTNNKLLIKK